MLIGTLAVIWALAGLLVDLELRRHTRYSRLDHLLLRIACWPVPILQVAIDAAYERACRFRGWP